MCYTPMKSTAIRPTDRNRNWTARFFSKSLAIGQNGSVAACFSFAFRTFCITYLFFKYLISNSTWKLILCKAIFFNLIALLRFWCLFPRCKSFADMHVECRHDTETKSVIVHIHPAVKRCSVRDEN